MNRMRENDDGHDSIQPNTNFCHKKGKMLTHTIADAIKSSMVHALALQFAATETSTRANTENLCNMNVIVQLFSSKWKSANARQ